MWAILDNHSVLTIYCLDDLIPLFNQFRVVWRHVAWGLALQFLFGLVILRWDVGKAVFECLGDKAGPNNT